MSTSKVFFCDLCVILLFGLALVLAEETLKSSAAIDVTKGNCSCGGFSTPTPEAGTPPIISQTPSLIVKCDDEGDSTCKQLCNALAIATKAKGPEILCNKLKDANELKLSAFYKVCDKPWQYANLTAHTPLCCENTNVAVCASDKLNATVEVDAKTIM